MRQHAALVAAVTLSFGAVAHAASDSLVTMGLGSHTLVSRFGGSGPDVAAQMGMGQGFSARLKLLRVLGFELSYDLISERAREFVNVATPKLQWSGLLYLVPTRPFSLYLAAGFGASAGGDLFSTSGSTTSYHAGGGIEVGVSRHWVLTADFRVNVPAYSQVIERGKEAMSKTGTELAVGDYYNLQTWQLAFGIRFYL